MEILIQLLILLPILMFSVILHEVSHGLVARHYGDDTALISGRLTLNPLPHLDPFEEIGNEGFNCGVGHGFLLPLLFNIFDWGAKW